MMTNIDINKIKAYLKPRPKLRKLIAILILYVALIAIIGPFAPSFTDAFIVITLIFIGITVAIVLCSVITWLIGDHSYDEDSRHY